MTFGSKLKMAWLVHSTTFWQFYLCIYILLISLHQLLGTSEFSRCFMVINAIHVVVACQRSLNIWLSLFFKLFFNFVLLPYFLFSFSFFSCFTNCCWFVVRCSVNYLKLNQPFTMNHYFDHLKSALVIVP
jgi:hypothetical protein